MTIKEVHIPPRIIVDLDDFDGPVSHLQVAQVLVLQRDSEGIQKKTFINVEVERGAQKTGVVHTIIRRVSKHSDFPRSFPLRFDMDAADDEYNATNTIVLKR